MIHVHAVPIALATLVAACGSASPQAAGGTSDAGYLDATDTGAPEGSDDGTTPATGPTIPVAITTASDGSLRATVQVSIGGGAPFTAILDTGSVGLHVLDGVVPASAWTVTSTPISTTYGTGVVTTGVVATAVVTVGGIATNQAIPVAKITSVACTASQPACEAAGKTATTFRFVDTYAANLGVGLRAASATGIASPLASMGKDQQYVVRFPAFGQTAGILELDPPPAEVALFKNLVALPSKGPATAAGIPAWDDTQVPFCMNSLCGVGILDTGAPSASISVAAANAYAELGVPAGSTTVPPGTAMTVTLNQASSWSFTVGNPPQMGRDVIKLGSGGIVGDNLSVAPFFQLDVFYDFAKGSIGLSPKL